MKKKTFVIDTNVLLYDPDAIHQFPADDVVIPLTVLEELDAMKRLPNELGKNSRQIIRDLDSLKNLEQGDLHTGVRLENGSRIRIQLEVKMDYEHNFSLAINDNRIIMAAYLLQERGEDVVFVSKDIASRLKAEAVGLEVEDYERLKVSYDSMPKEVFHIDLPKHTIDLFYKDGAIPGEEFILQPNQYCVMTSPENSSAVGRFNAKTGNIETLLRTSTTWGIKPRNVEQKCAVDLLLRDDIQLVTLLGPAGTGKTLLALACGLRKVFDEASYNRILISRPIVPLGRDIGFLPGTKEEKSSFTGCNLSMTI